MGDSIYTTTPNHFRKPFPKKISPFQAIPYLRFQITILLHSLFKPLLSRSGFFTSTPSDFSTVPLPCHLQAFSLTLNYFLVHGPSRNP